MKVKTPDRAGDRTEERNWTVDDDVSRSLAVADETDSQERSSKFTARKEERECSL